MEEDAENSELILNAKRKLYRLYYELSEYIKGEKIHINEDDFQENLLSTKIHTIIHYIKESIDIIKKRTTPPIETPKLPIKDHSISYQNQLKKLENDIRSHFKKLFQFKLQSEALELKLESYYKMEEEFEDMKEKLKYEEGQFLDNDRKDNEIFILRAENSNLKKVISLLEEDKKHFQTEKENDKVTIKDLKTQLEKLAEKVNQLEKNQKDINSTSNNSSINININNNGTSSTKWVIKHEDVQHPRNHISNSTDSKTTSDIPSSTRKTVKNSSYIRHHKMKSMNMIDRDKKCEVILGYNSENFQCKSRAKSKNKKDKNTNKVNQKDIKTPVRTQNQNKAQMVTSLSKIYSNQKGNKNPNKTIVSVRSISRLSQH